MIKTVIFDVGGVLVRTADHSYRREWENILGLANGESEEIVFNSEMGIKAQKGEISDDVLWSWVGQYLNLGNRLEAFRTSFWRGDKLDKELVTYIRSLRPGYQTAIISNATDGLNYSLNNTFKIADAFDLIVGSAEVKIMKPDPAIYEYALRGLNRAADESVFIDDFAHNIEAAGELGMATIHFKPGIDVPAELAKLGVHPNHDKEV
jgi:putative hydrolase of the HAD superfamily